MSDSHVFSDVFGRDDTSTLPGIKFERRLSPRRLSTLIIRDDTSQTEAHADTAEQE